MVTCAVFLRLNSLLKLAVLLLAVAVYSYLIHLAFLTLARHDMLHRSAPAQAMVFFFDIQFNFRIVLLAVFTTAVLLNCAEHLFSHICMSLFTSY